MQHRFCDGTLRLCWQKPWLAGLSRGQHQEEDCWNYFKLPWGGGHLTLRNSVLGTGKAPRNCGFGSRQPLQRFLHATHPGCWNEDAPGWAVMAVGLGRSMGLNDVALASSWGATGQRVSGAAGEMMLAGQSQGGSRQGRWQQQALPTLGHWSSLHASEPRLVGDKLG